MARNTYIAGVPTRPLIKTPRLLETLQSPLTVKNPVYLADESITNWYL